ncbi:restriction endonuclease [Pseudomonas viridiflava]|uniref:restriction endonuclease n=1 Tax=Pseudomonas viridiflava TaxID=33069 RepID=UPI001FD70D33|nr:restriction endonuclease [Pseudomonas viridiflava]MCJ8176828.1 restriction endonuclease [Pseudomonas viridiflava]
MSTVAKGDAFEEETFLFLKKELEAGRLGISPSSGRIFKRKGYYSKDREKDIVVDISIEVWLPGANNYSMLWVCECKDYGRSVPVDDVEEFKSKLDQIAGKNIKGVVATKNAFQEGAITYARNQGLGLVRIMPTDQVSWLIHYVVSSSAPIQQKPNPREFRAALSNDGYRAKERSFYSAYDGYIFGSWVSLIRHSLSDGT